MAHGLSRAAKWALSALALGATALIATPSQAQQHTFHLDRLEVPGAPEDGLVLFRPVTETDAILYAQIGLGYSLNPLRMADITRSNAILNASDTNAITHQFATYASVGVQLLDRLSLGLTMPIVWAQAGNELNSPSATFGGAATTAYTVGGPAVGDLRLDARYVVLRTDDRSAALGVQLSVFAPTGQGSSTNFGGDGSNVEAMPMITGEWTPSQKFPLAFVFNTGVDFRSENSIGDPAGQHGTADGIGVGNEWRWAVGVFLPIKGGRYRLGADVFGQTGISNDNITGPTAFTYQNSPIEWDVEGRMHLRIAGSEHWYVGAGGGSLIYGGYGAPDLRLVGLFGTYWELGDVGSNATQARLKVRESIRESMKDSDNDGIPDDVDACPDEPEDHKDPDPGDGCPAPADRDGDGVPDSRDKCPDEPGPGTADGCPNNDFDQDGIPNAQDACPHEPGQPDPDPKKNGCPKFIRLEGSTVRVLQQVHFATGSATILPDSFPMLTEIVKLLQATPAIKKMKVEGHTDNRGAAEMNLDLSKKRAASVVVWLTQHGVAGDRLASEGYGMTKPIDSNDNDKGRQANRRVEFHIEEEEGTPPPTTYQK